MAGQAWARAQPQKQLFATASSCHPQILPMGMAGASGDAPRCQRAGEHHCPAEQVSSPVAAGEEEGCFPPPEAFFPPRGRKLVSSQKSQKTPTHLPSGRNASCLGLSSCLCPWADFLPVTLFMLDENFRHCWPVRLWAVPSRDFHRCSALHTCARPNGRATTRRDKTSEATGQWKPLSARLHTGCWTGPKGGRAGELTGLKVGKPLL